MQSYFKNVLRKKIFKKIFNKVFNRSMFYCFMYLLVKQSKHPFGYTNAVSCPENHKSSSEIE